MKADTISPFIESVFELYSTMFSCKVQRGEASAPDSFSRGHEVVALIGLSGMVRGSVALTFPVQTAMNMVSRLLGIEVIGVDSDVLDAVGELVNIVAGGAKAKLNSATGSPIALSLPSLIQGASYHIAVPSYAQRLDIPFTSDLGPFTLGVVFESDPSGGAA